ncbi:MAG: D-glycero-beta-D-manno-heptose 1-phosphate adenylyltransferase [Saprospiraceae bacterium]
MDFISQTTAKIMLPDAAARLAAGQRLLTRKVVFTNGVFDLIHPGHLTYLAQARSLGDFLVVGLNADSSVRRLKGPTRPVMNEEARALLLASLACVDVVVLFATETPLDLITTIRPDLLVKGGDYQPDRIVGAAEVRADGGEVRVLPFIDGQSSTAIIDRLQK